ncbi:MAG TPA: aromatic ring-hydroxylating dioxygenase subunit alpha [Ktedonobacterales bacterium]|nr:aromatic ring-hydroxylating dioxygenase subunit alpha [Ktedonobacterales bacterium]
MDLIDATPRAAAGDDAPDALLDSLRQGYTLPATWYTDPALFQIERARIFRSSWQFAGYVEQLAERGDYFTTRVGDVPLVLTRDQADAIHAFVNVCRHRGSELAQVECGHGQTLQCQYHAWTYNLDGSLRAAPGAKDEPDFAPEQFSLLAVPVELWGPLIFVNLARQDAPPLSSVLGELPRLATEAGAPLDRMRRLARHTYDVAANWKVVVDNYLECYHCPVAHKGFTSLIDTNTYAITEYEWCSVQAGALKDSARDADESASDGAVSQNGATPERYSTRGAVQAGFYAYLWPNFTFNVYPGHGNVSINHFIPLAVDRTLVVKDYCFIPEVAAEEEDDFIRFINQVQVEDEALCASVQRGLSTGFFEQGRLMLRQERALRHFQLLVYRALADAAPSAHQR